MIGSRLILPLAALMSALATPAAIAQAADPAAARIERYFAGIEGVMKGGRALGVKGRADRFEPIVAAHYDIPGALALVGGSAIAGAGAADKAAATEALTRYNAVRHAGSFVAYNGERFVVEPAVQARGADKLVRGRITPKSGQGGAVLVYRMRRGADGEWRILDVVAQGVSQLALQRSEFGAALKGGLPGLTKRLQELNAKGLATTR